MSLQNPVPIPQLTKPAVVEPIKLTSAVAAAHPSPLMHELPPQTVHAATPTPAPRLQRPSIAAPLQCILGDEDDWIAVDTETRIALERILGEESRKEQKLDEYDMSDDYDCSHSERESDTCGSSGGTSGSDSCARGKVYLRSFQRNEWEAIPEEESSILSFDHSAFAPLQVLQRQQEARRISLLRENAARGSTVSEANKAETFKEKMKVELKQRVKELAASKRLRDSTDNANEISIPHPSEALAAKVDYTELFKNYLTSHLNALLPTIAGTAALATETDSLEASPREPTTPTAAGFDHASVPASKLQQKYSTPEYLLAHSIHNFSEDLVPCQHVNTQTDAVSTGIQGMLQSVDPLQLPSKAVKLLCFHEPRLGLVLASVPRAQGGDQMKTIVRAKMGEHIDAELAKYVNIGDELVSISGHDIKSLPYAQQVTTIATSKRPIVLGFASSN